jgi:hypothetical protein
MVRMGSVAGLASGSLPTRHAETLAGFIRQTRQPWTRAGRLPYRDYQLTTRSVTSWPCRAGCHTFLYILKRRLRAARKRAVLAAEYWGARVARLQRSPQPGPAAAGEGWTR